LNLTRAQRGQLLAGNYGPLVCEVKPYGCAPGAQYVLNWQQEKRTCDDDGNVFVLPRAPVRWITVTKVSRRQNGGWLVRFDVTDRRDGERYLRALPPVMAVGSESVGDGSESYYQSSRFNSIDPLPAVSKDYQDHITKKAREEFGFLKKLQHREQLGELHERVRRLEEAHRMGADVGRQIRRVEAAIEAAERRLEKDAA
jgi:hypothetical protein